MFYMTSNQSFDFIFYCVSILRLAIFKHKKIVLPITYCIIASLFIFINSCYAQEQLSNLKEENVPVLNEELRKLKSETLWKKGSSVIELKDASDIDVQDKEMKNMRIENRTSDPSSPTIGRIWLRSDL